MTLCLLNISVLVLFHLVVLLRLELFLFQFAPCQKVLVPHKIAALVQLGPVLQPLLNDSLPLLFQFIILFGLQMLPLHLIVNFPMVLADETLCTKFALLQ